MAVGFRVSSAHLPVVCSGYPLWRMERNGKRGLAQTIWLVARFGGCAGIDVVREFPFIGVGGVLLGHCEERIHDIGHWCYGDARKDGWWLDC